MKKSKKKAKSKSAYAEKLKPYTLKQENDIFIGKLLHWCFLLSFPVIGLLSLAMSWNIYVCLFVWGISSLVFGVYNLAGLIFKWDHARVCVKSELKKAYKIDIRNAWSKDDIKDSITTIVIWCAFGVIFIIGSICRF